MSYLRDLNEQQREAVLQTEGPLLIIAGAGSGKTKTLTMRIAHLLKEGISPFEILALTFTNKAAREMKERIDQALANRQSSNLYIGTFHSVFARILRGEAATLGYSPNFVIYDTDEARSVLKSVMDICGLDTKKHYHPKKILPKISHAKNQLIAPDEYANNPRIRDADEKAQYPMIATIYSKYVRKCFENGAMDFDDLLVNMYRLLSEFPEKLYKYQHKFRYIMIDEYQDTNLLQYKIIRLLAGQHRNLCVVGDDAQSIYGFRGATIQNILNFQNDYAEAKIIKLEQNYRSTQSILETANAIIAHNKQRIDKQLWTDNIAGEQVQVLGMESDLKEAAWVADMIKEQRLRYHYTPRDFAILYRQNTQSRVLEEALRRAGIPYKIYGGISFYQRSEVKDILAYLKVILNPKEEESLRRIINKPTRGIGDTTVAKALILATDNQCTLWDILLKVDSFDFKPKAQKAIEEFVQFIIYCQSELRKKSVYDFAQMVAKDSGYMNMLYQDQDIEGRDKIEHVQHLLNGMQAFQEGIEVGDAHPMADTLLPAYLQDIALLTSMDEKDKNDKQGGVDVVQLMTIHSAKGLEFPCVFIVGMEEGVFPNHRVFSEEELEEERRLFYVAVSRAEEKIWISYAQNKYMKGDFISNEPSQFLEELPDKYVHIKRIAHFKTTFPSKKRNEYEGNIFSKPTPPSPFRGWKGANALHSISNAKDTFRTTIDIKQFQVGKRVEHERFGKGTILRIEGKKDDPIAIISFDIHNEKKILLNYVKLRILS